MIDGFEYTRERNGASSPIGWACRYAERFSIGSTHPTGDGSKCRLNDERSAGLSSTSAEVAVAMVVVRDALFAHIPQKFDSTFAYNRHIRDPVAIGCRGAAYDVRDAIAICIANSQHMWLLQVFEDRFVGFLEEFDSPGPRVGPVVELITPLAGTIRCERCDHSGAGNSRRGDAGKLIEQRVLASDPYDDLGERQVAPNVVLPEKSHNIMLA